MDSCVKARNLHIMEFRPTRVCRIRLGLGAPAPGSLLPPQQPSNVLLSEAGRPNQFCHIFLWSWLVGLQCNISSCFWVRNALSKSTFQGFSPSERSGRHQYGCPFFCSFDWSFTRAQSKTSQMKQLNHSRVLWVSCIVLRKCWRSREYLWCGVKQYNVLLDTDGCWMDIYIYIYIL